MRTYTPKPGDITRVWHVIDAEDIVLGRLASQAAQSTVYSHSGFPGGLKKTSYAEVLATRPERIIEKAIKGMLPHTRLGRQMASKLKVYAGPEHPHSAQQPQQYEITQIAQ